MSLADPAEVRAHLIASARARQSITYSELLAHLGYAFSRPKMRALCKVLEAVDAETEGRGEPELAVLVVRQSDGLPGQGWWIGSALSHGYKGDWDGPDARRLIRRLHAQAFDYWSER
ncbi:ribose-phosphate pyrophosphokinase [Sphingomonas sp. HDW15A]|uniref:ribose-phosphate pyrophosphokinase n=1 Tax=Sphingomonas sp. HDW15A TaxID=2714942 RepID=UPI001F0CF21E|nr:ribose-phosphate pyrophosphokinase [Sphingomonas sp. HDW15A]